MEHHHDQPLGLRGSPPFAVGAVTVEGGHVTVDYVAEEPVHRHFQMNFRAGESESVDAALEGLATVLIAHAQTVMLDLMAKAAVPDSPDDILERIVKCCVCDGTATIGTPGWRPHAAADPTSDTVIGWCPVHDPSLHG